MSKAMRITAAVLVFSLVLLAPMGNKKSAVLAQPGCQDCVRRGVIVDFTTNSDFPNLETSIDYRVWEAMITPCFHFLSSMATGAGKAAEYTFRISYMDNLEGDVKSRLTISMYFNGESEELVKTWTTEGDRPTQGFPYHSNKMFRNDSAVLRQERDIDQKLIKDFEKRPEACEVNLDKDKVFPGEEVEARVERIEDIKGRKSREFNRVVVQAVEGEIIGGESQDVGSDLKAFKVGDGTVKFKYRAPSSSDLKEDTINVYNCCDVLPEGLVPMSKCAVKDKIATKKVQIQTADATLTLEGSEITTHDHDSNEKNYHENIHIKETVEATITLSLTLGQTLEIPNYAQIWEYYRADSRDIQRFQAVSSERDERGSPGDKWESRHTVDGTGGKQKIDAPFMNDQVIVVFDKKTKKAVKAIVPGYSVSFDWEIHDKFHSEQWSGDSPVPKIEDRESSSHKNDTLHVGPVEASIPDPTINPNALQEEITRMFKERGLQPPANIPGGKQKEEKIRPEYLVKSGDGETTMGGEGKKVDENTGPKSRDVRERKFKWHLTRKKK
jgi:hypothetical protein